MTHASKAPTEGFLVDPWNIPLKRPGMYLFTNLKNGKTYVGISHDVAYRCYRHSLSSDSTKFHRALRWHGREAFRLDVLYYALDHSTDGLTAIETEMIRIFDSIRNGYNILESDGTVGPYGETFDKIVKTAKNRPEAKAKTARAMAAIFAREDSPHKVALFAGLTPDVITRRNASIRAALSNPAYKAARSAAVSNLIWITDGVSNRRIPREDDIPEGWRRGKEGNRAHGPALSAIRLEQFSKPGSRDKLGKHCLGRRWITDDVNSRRILPDDAIPEGWRLGKTYTIKS